MILKIESRSIFKNYGVEISSMYETLLRAGIPVSRDFQLLEKHYLQNDLNRYVGNILGLTADQPGDFYKHREVGDYYTLGFNPGKGEYWIEYVPHKGNKHGTPKKVLFEYPDIVKGVIKTYISKISCSKELAAQLPEAMIREVLENYKRITN